MATKKLAALEPVTAAPALTKTEVSAIKALAQHNPVAFDAIVKKICGIGAVCFRPGDPYSTAFMDGRRFPAVVLIDVLNSKTKVDNERPAEQP